MAILINHTTVQGTGATRTSSPVDMTGANLFVAGIIQSFSGTNVIADSQSNSWQSSGSSMVDPSFFTQGGIRYVVNPTTSSSQTFSYSGSNSNQSAVILGFRTAISFDKLNTSNSSTSSTTLTLNSFTPTAGPDLVVSLCGKVGDAGVCNSIDSGFTIGEDINFIGGQQYGLTIGYKSQATPASVGPLFTMALAPNYLTGQQIAFLMSSGEFSQGYIIG